MDFVQIQGLELSCIIGVRPAERRTKQVVHVDLDMGLDLSRAGQSGRIGQTVDYSQVAEEISALLGFRDYQLLEVSAEEICAMLFGAHAGLECIAISIQKPAALKGRARSGGVKVTRERNDATRRRRAVSFGEVELLMETHEAELRLLHLQPGMSVPSDSERSIEWLVGGHVESNGVPLTPHEPRVFPEGRNQIYVNCGVTQATIFSCLHRPTK